MPEENGWHRPAAVMAAAAATTEVVSGGANYSFYILYSIAGAICDILNLQIIISTGERNINK